MAGVAVRLAQRACPGLRLSWRLVDVAAGRTIGREATGFMTLRVSSIVYSQMDRVIVGVMLGDRRRGQLRDRLQAPRPGGDGVGPGALGAHAGRLLPRRPRRHGPAAGPVRARYQARRRRDLGGHLVGDDLRPPPAHRVGGGGLCRAGRDHPPVPRVPDPGLDPRHRLDHARRAGSPAPGGHPQPLLGRPEPGPVDRPRAPARADRRGLGDDDRLPRALGAVPAHHDPGARREDRRVPGRPSSGRWCPASSLRSAWAW